MTIFDVFSKRQKKLRGEVPDVYTYGDLPQPLRIQIVHIILETLGKADQYWEVKVKLSYEFIVKTLCREYRAFSIARSERIW